MSSFVFNETLVRGTLVSIQSWAGNVGWTLLKFHLLLAVGRWFPPGTPVSSTKKLISSSFHRLDMTLGDFGHSRDWCQDKLRKISVMGGGRGW